MSFSLNKHKGADHSRKDNMVIGLVTVASLYKESKLIQRLTETDIEAVGAWMGTLTIEQMQQLHELSKLEV